MVRVHANQTIMPAWKMAVLKREITETLLFHSDRGIQYASKAFVKLLKSYAFATHGFRPMYLKRELRFQILGLLFWYNIGTTNKKLLT